MYETIYYKWIAADLLINFMSSWTYLGKLEKIAFEQQESSQHFYKIEEHKHLMSIINNKTGEINERKRLSINANYYSLTFCSYIKYYRQKYLITSEQKSLFLFNAILVFSI